MEGLSRLLCSLVGFLATLRLGRMQDITTVVPQDMYTFAEMAPIYARYLRVDPLDPEHVYVGAMNYVYRLPASRIDQTFFVEKSTSLGDAGHIASVVCHQTAGLDTDFVCKNHIRTIMLLDHDQNNATDPVIYVCGTDSKSPTEQFLRRSDLVVINGTKEKAANKCPYHPDDSYTCSYAARGNPSNLPSFYSGTIKISKQQLREPVIYRPPIQYGGHEVYDLLQTQSPSDDANWIQEAQFVGSFERGNYVYFFFHEAATEFEDCLVERHATVARVCKNDEGGRNSRQTQWTSFFKARIDCTIPGSYPFRFNIITDVKQTRTGFIGTFVRDGNPEVYGSAICRYSYSALEAAFNGPFLTENDDHKWEVVKQEDVPSRRPGSCIQNSQGMTDAEFTFVNDHQLMALRVEPELVDNLPHFYKMGVLFEKFVIDTSQYYTVYFIATNEGEIYKIVWLPTQRRAKILAIYKPFNTPTRIWSMVSLRDSVYLGTDAEVKQLRLGQCTSYTTCNTCAQDPYCGWNPRAARCETFVSNRVQLARDVEMTNLTACARVGACNTPYRELSVRIPGRPVAFTCTSHCVGSEPIRWLKDQQPLDMELSLPDGQPKYMRTAENGLVIWNATTGDEGIYTCLSGRFQFAEYGLRLPGCAYNDEKCHWETEFTQWCDEFDKYQKEFNNWVCVKNECFRNEENCLPGAEQTCAVTP